MGLCWSCPHQETVAVVEGFGKFNRIAYPGCNCLNPLCGEGVAGLLSLRVQQIDVTVETKTKDNVFCILVVSIMYQVRQEQLEDAFYKLTNIHAQLSSYVFDTIRATVPKLLLDEVFLEKEAIAGDIRTELTKSMSSFGYDILQALVTDISPAAKVKAAMNEICANQRLRMAALHKAEAQKIRVVKAAEAEAEAKYLQGYGVAGQRAAIITGLKDSVKEFSERVPGVQSRDVMELVLTTQYMDALKEIGANPRCTTVFMNDDDTGVDGGSSMRKALLEAAAAQQAPMAR